jgi:hypothetical protein
MNDLNKTDEYAREIKAWLESDKDFNAGYLLFVRFSHNRAMALQFARKGASLQSKLEYELEKILERNLIIERPVFPIGPVVKAQVKAENVIDSDVRIQNQEKKFELNGGKINPAELPEPLRILFDENSEKHKLMRSVHEAMKLAKTDKTRAELRKKLVDLDDRVSANWKVIDHYLETGELPKAPDAKSGKETELFKQINAARSYVSRGLNGLDKKKEKQRVKAIAEIKNRFEFLVANKAEVSKKTLEALKKLGITHEDPGNK